MFAILKRELSAYFNSIIGYIFIAVIYFFGGLFFWVTSVYSGNADLSGVFSNIMMIVEFIIPILTMRIISEDFKLKTDQALLTAPISTASIALGKYFSAVIVYLIGISITLVYGAIVSFFTIPDWVVIIGSFTGILVMGMALIAIGMFISSLTESQIVAAIISYAVSIFIILMDGLLNFFKSSVLYMPLSYLSFSKHYKSFTLGIVNLADVTFFLTICAFFVFLTAHMIEKRKWN